MRFWITKNSELPIREQLAGQIMLAILSDDLPAGHKLPSIREMARRYDIHSNTVSAAYHDLLGRGWVELRRGSGMYVRPLRSSGVQATGLDMLLADLLRTALSQGHEPAEVLHRLEEMILPRKYSRVAIVEPDPGMREILLAEVGEHLRIPVDAVEPSDLSASSTSGACLVTALPTRAMKLREWLPRGIPLMTLRLRSVRGSLERHTKPPPDAIISIVSKSPEFRQWAHAILIAVGIDVDCLCDIDATLQGWQERARAGALVVTDIVTVRRLPSGCRAEVFRVIADSCIAEIKQLCTP